MNPGAEEPALKDPEPEAAEADGIGVGAAATGPAAARTDPAADSEAKSGTDRVRFWHGWCLGTRLVVAAALLWLAFAVARPLLSGRLAWWSLLDLVPPVALLAVPVLFAAAIPALRLVRIRLPRSARWSVAGLAVAALAAGFPQSGLNIAALGGAAPAPPANALHVTVWDTVGWDTKKDSDAFYRYLIDQHSDVYVLQEYLGVDASGAPVPINDKARLRAAFPGFHIAASGELLTLSRYPIVGQHTVGAALRPSASLVQGYWPVRILRTDLDIGGRVVSIYNLHLPDLLSFAPSPFTPAFYEESSELAGWRNAEMGALKADLAADRHPVVVAGSLNLVPGSAALGAVAGLQDAGHASRSLYPVSFWVGHLEAWRMDWTFVSPGVRVYRYDLISPQGLSTHRAQNIVLSLPNAG